MKGNEVARRFFFAWFGYRYPPPRPKDWFRRRGRDALVDKEAWLYFAVHGPVFYDPLGEYSARRQAFAHYPRDVRLKPMAELCLSIWGLGEYKFSERHIHRRDPVAIGICLGQFAQKVMRLCFLLNDDYAPHEVWIHHEFRKLPEAAVLDEQLVRLATSRDLEEQRDIILDVGRYLRGRMLAQELVDSDQRGYGLRCREIEARIEDPAMRRM